MISTGNAGQQCDITIVKENLEKTVHQMVQGLDMKACHILKEEATENVGENMDGNQSRDHGDHPHSQYGNKEATESPEHDRRYTAHQGGACNCSFWQTWN